MARVNPSLSARYKNPATAGFFVSAEEVGKIQNPVRSTRVRLMSQQYCITSPWGHIKYKSMRQHGGFLHKLNSSPILLSNKLLEQLKSSGQ